MDYGSRARRTCSIRTRATGEAASRKSAWKCTRPSDTVGRIDVARGKAPVVSGTRVPTARIWELHEAGQSARQIVDAYSGITANDVRAAIDFENGRRKKTA